MSVVDGVIKLKSSDTTKTNLKSSSVLVFFVNGRKVVDNDVDPEWTLLTYLRRKLRLCGTKLGCGEGGCGACTVMVSKYNREMQSIEHLSVNACLAPVCSMHGLAVTTVEGIGSTRKKLHVVQERIAKFHGSQCGFCTPGIVMSMYTLLRNNPKPSMEDIDTYFQGNLCRCTGYRPIIEGFRTLTDQRVGVSSSMTNGGTVFQGSCKGLVNGKCCQMQDGEIDSDLPPPDIHSVHPYLPDQEPIFPPELQLNALLDEQYLIFHGRNMVWYRPICIKELMEIKGNNKDAKIVVGNTELGIEMKFKNCHYPMMIVPSHVKELNEVIEFDDGVKFGAAVTLSRLEDVCQQQKAIHPEWKVQVFTEICKMLRYFGGKQIRNVAAIGGNIMTGSPISDLNPIFMAAGCCLEVLGKTGIKSIKLDNKFFTGYRRNVIKSDELLLSIKVPFTNESEFFQAFKQSRRRDDDIAIVNAAFRLQLSKGVVEHITMCYGGMAPTTVMATKTMEFMLSKQWNSAVIEEALSILLDDLPLDPGVPGGMVRYRQSLALSFLFKFYLNISVALDPQHLQLPSSCLSATHPLVRGELKSHQFYQLEPGSEKKLSVGAPIVHSSAHLQATGEAVYCDDMPIFENELYLGLVLSTKAHAKILRINESKALQIEGTVDFICHKDLPKERNSFAITSVKDEEVFASEYVHAVGQIIGVVIAIDKSVAKRAAKEVEVDYEEMKPIVTIEDAMKAESFYPLTKKIEKGKPQEVLMTCDQMITGEMRTGAQEHFYLETNAAIAVPKGESGEMEIHASTQNPTQTQMIIANVLGVPANRIVCRVKRIGGGFGGKETRTIPLSVATAVAANKVGKPVRIMLDRDEDILTSGYRHPFYSKYKVGFNNDGMIVAGDVNLYNNAGNTRDLSVEVVEHGVFHATNAYYVPDFRVDGKCCKTNLISNTSFRGFGNPQAMMMAENWMNDIALLLGKDPAIIREKNLFKKGQKTHYNQEIEEDALYRCWQECLKQSKYYEVRVELDEYNENSKYKKKGIAIVPTMYGLSYGALFLNQAGALVNVYVDGSVLLSHGGTEMGQGLHTKMIQVASEVLQVDVSKIHILGTATDKVPNTSPTSASISSDLNGMAIYNACCKINKRLEKYRKAKCSWEDAVKAAYFDRVSLSATGYYATPDLSYDFDTNTGRAFAYYAHGAACCIVEIDCLTGDHQVLKSDIVMDVGQSINPAIDIGQIEGAFMQGYGLFVLEQLVHSPNGMLLTRGPGAYKIPTFNDIPVEFNVSLLKDSSNPRAVYSSKGIGEPPLFLASSVFFAIKDAIIAARKERGLSNMFKLEAPATAERIRMACEDEITRRVPTITEGTYTPWGIQV